MDNGNRSLASRVLRSVIILVVALSVLKVWLSPAPLVDRAQAQIPDAGTQRVAQLEEIRRTNALLQQLIDTLEHQTIKVRVEGLDKAAADRAKGAGAPRPAPGGRS